MKIVMGHSSLDFDALASMVAAKRLFPGTVMVAEGKSNATVQEFVALTRNHFPCLRLKDVEIDNVESVILVDTNDLCRAVSPEQAALLTDKPLFIFDHHQYNGELSENIVVETVGACTTILVERLSQQHAKITTMEATLLLLGIYDDTGSLLLDNTTHRDAAAVAWLLKKGGQLGVVSEYLRRPLIPEQMDLFQQLMQNGSVAELGGTPVYISYAETSQYVSGLALLIHKLREIEDADVWFIVVKMPGRINIIGRSKGDSLPVRDILQQFRGSGHRNAASATLKREDLFGVLDELRLEISKYVEQPNLARDIMSFPVHTVTTQTTMEETGQILIRYAHSGMPVMEEEKLVGVISRRDVDKALKYNLGHAPVKGFMSTSVVTGTPSMHCDTLQKLMVAHDIGRVPIVEDGTLVGIVSRTDVLRLVYGSAVSADVINVEERSLANREDTLSRLRALPEESRSILDTVTEVANNIGFSVYLVGGFVRDLLLNVPTQDFDLVVEGNSLAFAELLREKLNVYKFVKHEEFGTVRLSLKNGPHIDIAGSRLEEYDHPGAMPHVERSSLRDDLFRRDFTINTMALSLNKSSYGHLVDYYGGSRDLRQKEIRFLHNLSFIDDATRIMRAFRFAGRYDFRLDKVTREAVGVALEAGALGKVSQERFTEEWWAIYQEKNYQLMLSLLETNQVLTCWFGAVLPWHTAEDSESASRWTLARKWLISLKHMNEDEINLTLTKLKLSRSMLKSTHDYLHLRRALAELRDLDDLDELDGVLQNVPYFLRDIIAEQAVYREKMAIYEKARLRVRTNLNGLDIVHLGVQEGPLIGLLLRQVRRLWLHGEITNAAEEQEQLEKLIQLTGLY